MNLRVRRALFFCCSLFISIAVNAQDSRGINFNTGWRFWKSDLPGAEKNLFDDSKWQAVDLPHDWSIEGPFSDQWASGTGYLPGGIGWYRKKFTLSENLKDKKVYLYFDGVYKNSEVWINERYLGKRPNGYASFYYDITPYLNNGELNVIAVRVDHTDFADSRWYTGSGINRNVYLIPVEKSHIDIWGVKFSTPSVTGSKAEAVVDMRINNFENHKGKLTLMAELLSRDGKRVAGAIADVASNASTTRSRLRFTVNNPALWSPESPILYTLRTSLSIDGKEIDVLSEPVGFRYMSFDAANGFFLNGKSVKLKGVCFHDDAGALGTAVPRAVWERRLTLLKEMGCNAIRMSHNPHQDYIYDLCDRLGFLVQDEAFDEWEIGKNKWIAGWNVGTPGRDGYNRVFNGWAERDLEDMVLRNQNRVSIIMWSIGNEIDYPNDPYTHKILNTGRNPQIYGRGYEAGNPPVEKMAEIAKRLVKEVMSVDTTRFVTAALAGVVMSNMTDYPELLDVVGYNYQEYRYGDDHAKYPGRIIYGSENGKSFEAWSAVAENKFISGQFLWTAFDFLGEARAWPSRSSGAGLIDMAGFPKPEYYQRKSWWTAEPMVYAAVTPVGGDRRDGGTVKPHWNWSPGDSVRVVVFANISQAELLLNGKSLGRKQIVSGRNEITWDIVFQSGELRIIGFSQGKPVASKAIMTAGQPKKVIASSDKRVLIGADDVAHIEIGFTDDKNIPVATVEDEIVVNIEGPGKLIGLESGSLTSHEDYTSNRRKSKDGKLLAFVQSTGKGSVRVKISAANMKSYEIEIDAE